MDDCLEDLIKKAECGDDHDLYSVGLYYYRNEDYKNAYPWFIKAAEKNNDLAFFKLVTMNQYGLGIDKNYSEALKYLLKRIEVCKEDSFPKTYLGECYLNGNLVKQDYDKAVEIFKSVLAQNEEEEDDYDGNALYWLGKCYENGWGVQKDIDTAIDFYKRAIEYGNDDAYFALGKIYYYGNDVKQDYSKAFKYLKETSYFNEDAQILLGKCYLDGLGVKQDYKKAFEIFYEVAQEDNKEAKWLVIKCYENGWGVKKDLNKVLELTSEFDSEDW